MKRCECCLKHISLFEYECKDGNQKLVLCGMCDTAFKDGEDIPVVAYIAARMLKISEPSHSLSDIAIELVPRIASISKLVVWESRKEIV